MVNAFVFLRKFFGNISTWLLGFLYARNCPNCDNRLQQGEFKYISYSVQGDYSDNELGSDGLRLCNTCFNAHESIDVERILLYITSEKTIALEDVLWIRALLSHFKETGKLL